MKLTSLVEAMKSRTEEVVHLVRKVEGRKREGGSKGGREEGRKIRRKGMGRLVTGARRGEW